jgi:HTH-type transcriptional regulator, quorum sensing regulator NprR
MYEGKIIKFYREKSQLTQEQLGKGICSGTHISKIERLQTEYAPEIIILLSERLGINMNEELNKLMNIKNRIAYWQDVIVMELKDEMDSINTELEQEELIQISEYIFLYKLLNARYLLVNNKIQEAFKIIKEIQKTDTKLTLFESNLLKHVLGIYYLVINNYQNAIHTLKEIQTEIYNNPEYYYHLAMAYHTIQSPVLAYFYAEKARQFFKEKNIYPRVIDAEMIMLIQAQDDSYNDEIIKRFENLLISCDLCYAPERKAKVSHNLGYEYFRIRKFEQASRYYYESMMLKDKESSSYLLSLEGYIRSSYEGDLLPDGLLLQLVLDGAAIAKKKKLLLFIHLFKLLTYLIKSKELEYHQYLQDQALPMFENSGYVFLIKRSKKELFNYYNKMQQFDKALNIAGIIINPH